MLKNAYASIAPEGWIAADAYRFKATRHVRRSLDKELLRSRLSTCQGIEPEALISACETEGQPFTRLVVNEIK